MIVNKLIFSKWSASGLHHHGFVSTPSGTVVLGPRIQTHRHSFIAHTVTGLSETQLLVDLEVVCGIVAKIICWHLELLFKIVSMCMCAYVCMFAHLHVHHMCAGASRGQQRPAEGIRFPGTHVACCWEPRLVGAWNRTQSLGENSKCPYHRDISLTLQNTLPFSMHVV